MSSVFEYADWSTSKQDAVVEAYLNDYLILEGFDRLHLESFLDVSTAFASVSNPSWSNTTDWRVLNLRTDTEFKDNTYALGKVARCIYAENSNIASSVRKRSMRATAEVFMNRRDNPTSRWENTLEGVVLQSGQFSAMSDGNIGASNPVYYNSDLAGWCYAVFLANHLYSNIEPYGRQELDDDIYYFYDIGSGMPFYKYSGGTYTACTSANVSGATHYRYSGNYYPIWAGPVKIGNHVYFSWD